MKNRYLLFNSYLLLWLIPFVSKGQSVAVEKAEMIKVFEKINTWFRTTPSYSLTVTHASYEDYTSTTPADKTTGYFEKEGANYHSFLLGIHTIQNSKYKLVIDTSQKVILVANPDQLTWLSYTQEDYQGLLKSCTALRMNKTGRYTFYRMELPESNPIGAYEFLIDEEGLAREISWYYNKEVKKDEGDERSKVKPRMNISFSGYKKDAVINYSEEFSEAPYFIKKDKKLVATDKYKKYKLLDQRLRD
jgi:hypothetical protein